MTSQHKLLALTEVPTTETETFNQLIKDYRKQYIRTSDSLVDEVFAEEEKFSKLLAEKQLSLLIKEAREKVWQKFLIEEAEFNTIVLRDLHKKIDTPQQIINTLLTDEILSKREDALAESIKDLCGEYAGRVYPYIYALSLSNTNSRRARSGKTFECIIYKLYDLLEYPFASQGKVGRKIFDAVGLGKKVDSVLPSIEAFSQRRNKTIIGTMKTSLRERWQEVAEEIERTKIPEIHLLTVDDKIALSKAKEMANHNIVIVGLQELSEQSELSDMKNIISFEEYFYDEIPEVLEFWEKTQ